MYLPALVAEREQEVVKHNDIIQKSRFQLSVQEQKVIQFLISKIKPTDEKFHVYRFNIAEFCNICGIDDDNGKNYKNIKNTIMSLRNKGMWLELTKNKIVTVSWINKAVINKYDGIIEIRLDDDLMPYLLQLKENYTKYALKYILAMDSQYSIRLFEILRSLEYQKREQIFDLDHLRRLLNAENYSRYPDFLRRAIEPAIQEINKYTDLIIDYKPIKEGRKTVKIAFTIMQKTNMGERLEAWVKIDEKLQAKD